MADQMSGAFLAFAKTGNPNCNALPKWEPYSLPRRRTMVFNVPSKLVDDPRGGERKLFEKVPFVQAGT
jgi:para-nitrobenzyl esterase